MLSKYLIKDEVYHLNFEQGLQTLIETNLSDFEMTEIFISSRNHILCTTSSPQWAITHDVRNFSFCKSLAHTRPYLFVFPF